MAFAKKKDWEAMAKASVDKPPILRVLVACEVNGRIRDAFRGRGHDAWSCDILSSDSPFHIQDDVLSHLNDGWELMIAHPPCTHLSVSGARWFTEGKKDYKLREDALEFVRKLMEAEIKYIAVENPVSVISSQIRKPDQLIHPWQFGHPEEKRTCLWLKNLPKLIPTNDVYDEMMKLPKKERHKIWWMGSGHSAERSITYQGWADAMADQWPGKGVCDYD